VITRKGIADIKSEAELDAASANVPATTNAAVAAALSVKRWVAVWLRKYYGKHRI
jgi:hypothetical protein